jgi:asparagine synthase (glutamine-hydrolysing)
MCGIAGVLCASAPGVGLTDAVRRMSARLVHRGPDDEGVWTDEDAGVGLGFRRLAIIDLSPAGAQPMASADGRWVVVFNGEVYNHRELRAELEASGARFRGRSDTEVLVEAIARRGLTATLGNADAMFAVAAWDRRERELHLAVDRFGEKPLYYGWAGSSLVFGSELDALRAYPGVDRTVDPRAVADLLSFGYIGAPRSIYAAVAKVEPGTALRFSPTRPGSPPHRVVWWSAAGAAVEARREACGEPLEALHSALSLSVRRRMVADVPVGAFLSGGVDSSLIAALMQEQASGRVRTFTVGFDRPDYDESAYARQVASILGTDHHEERLTIAEAVSLVPRLPDMLDEPLADASVLPTHLVSQMARRHVTVALTGDGGDELFGGYGRHHAHRYWAMLQKLPGPVVKLAAGVGRATPPSVWRRIGALAGHRLETRLRQARLAEKLEKMSHAAEAPDPGVLFDRLRRLWPAANLPVPGGAVDDPQALVGEGLPPSEQAMLADTVHYLPGDLLAKTDRAAMAVALEARLPFLSPDVYAAAWSMPGEWRAGDGEGKRVARRLLCRYLPEELVDRPKMGFGVPVSDWLSRELREWAGDLLSEASLTSSGLLDPRPIRRAWSEHLSGRRDHGQRLWAVCTLQDWLLAEQRSGAAVH